MRLPSGSPLIIFECFARIDQIGLDSLIRPLHSQTLESGAVEAWVAILRFEGLRIESCTRARYMDIAASQPAQFNDREKNRSG